MLEARWRCASAIVYATLIDVVAVVPVFFLEGLSGAFFRPLALSYALAVLASMVVALTVTPALCLILLSRRHARAAESPLVRVAASAATRGPGADHPHAAARDRHRRPSSCWPASWWRRTLGQSLLPDFKERDFLMHWLTKPGTSQPEDGADHDSGQQGAARHPRRAQLRRPHRPGLPGGRVVRRELRRELDQRRSRRSTMTRRWPPIQETVDGYPGLYRDVQTYLKERIREVLTGASEAIVVRIYGPDLECSAHKADEVERTMRGIDGIVEAHVELQDDVPQIEVEVDLAAAKRYGLKPGDVRRAAATLVAGEEVGDIFRDGKAYDVHVWSTPETRHSLTDIRELLIDTPGRRAGPLERRGRRSHRADAERHRPRAQSRRIDVGANVRGPRPRLRRARDVEDAARRRRIPARVPRRGTRRVQPSGQAAQQTPADLRPSPRRRRSSSCCWRPSAAGVWPRCSS